MENFQGNLKGRLQFCRRNYLIKIKEYYKHLIIINLHLLLFIIILFIPMSESIFFPKFDQIKHFDTLNFVLPHVNLLPEGVQNMKQIMDPTQDATIEKEKYQSRSMKVIADPLDISFQQSFMDEHRTCFIKQIQNYMEHQSDLLEPHNKNKSTKSDDYENDMTDLFTLPQMIRQYGTSLSEQKREMFIIDLKRQDKLSEFLQFILYKVKDDSIKEVIHLVNQIWEEYILVQDLAYNLQQTIEFADAFVNKHVQKLDQKLNIINFKSFHKHFQSKNDSSQKKERFNSFKKFLTFFTTTICLVIGGFFENPYSENEQNYYKRELQGFNQEEDDGDDFNESDSEGDDEGILSKRIKF